MSARLDKFRQNDYLITVRKKENNLKLNDQFHDKRRQNLQGMETWRVE